MKTPRFTDSARFSEPYADEKASKEPNYLRDKFARIIERQRRDEAEAKAKTVPMRRAAK